MKAPEIKLMALNKGTTAITFNKHALKLIMEGKIQKVDILQEGSKINLVFMRDNVFKREKLKHQKALKVN